MADEYLPVHLFDVGRDRDFVCTESHGDGCEVRLQLFADHLDVVKSDAVRSLAGTVENYSELFRSGRMVRDVVVLCASWEWLSCDHMS